MLIKNKDGKSTLVLVRQMYICLHFKSNLCLARLKRECFLHVLHTYLLFCKKGFTRTRYWSNPIFFVKGLKESSVHTYIFYIIHKNVFSITSSMSKRITFYIEKIFCEVFHTWKKGQKYVNFCWYIQKYNSYTKKL